MWCEELLDHNMTSVKKNRLVSIVLIHTSISTAKPGYTRAVPCLSWFYGGVFPSKMDAAEPLGRRTKKTKAKRPTNNMQATNRKTQTRDTDRQTADNGRTDYGSHSQGGVFQVVRWPMMNVVLKITTDTHRSRKFARTKTCARRRSEWCKGVRVG